VTEKATNRILAYPVEGGLAGDPVVTASAGTTPFGFSDRRHLVVSEAFGGAPNGSALSSYALKSNGLLTTLSASVGTQQTAACWVVVTNNGNNGTLTLIGNGVAGMTGAGPIDMALGHNSQFLLRREHRRRLHLRLHGPPGRWQPDAGHRCPRPGRRHRRDGRPLTSARSLVSARQL
jgi:hypothetical protein